MATFIQTEPLGNHATLNVDLDALAAAGNDEGSETSDRPRGESTRKATVRRGPRMGKFRPHAATMSGNDDDNMSVHSHQRRGEISAEPIKQSNSVPYRKTLIVKDDTARKLLRAAVDDCLLFSELSDPGRWEVVDAFRKVEGTRGKRLIEEGDWGDEFYVLESGTCEAVKVMHDPKLNDKVPVRVKTYESGGSFGELALMYNEPRAATVKITSDKAVLWAVDRMTFKNISVHFKVLRQKQYEDSLKRIPGLTSLSSDEIGRLVDCVEERTYPPNSTIFTKGDSGNDAIVLIEGKATYISSGEQGTASAGDVFGAGALLLTEIRDRTLQTNKEQTCVVMSLSRVKMEEVLGRDLGSDSAAVRNSTRPMSILPSKQQPQAPNHRHHIAIKFEDLEMQLGVGSAANTANPSPNNANGATSPMAAASPSAPVSGTSSGRFFRADTVSSVASSAQPKEQRREIVLGVGTFGKVIIVRHTPSGDTFAMKRLNKSWIVENGLQQHVVDERNVMTLTDHPFILKLHNSYHDERYVYLLLELCLGGELFMYLRKFSKFNEQQARFYAASIVLAFEHLHQKGIVYRDLKPENLMLDDVGFLKVVDFGLAKVVKGRTWTICGTPEYLAPEVVLSKGHNRGVDYWALGILIFELTAGYCPFQGEDNMQIYRQIVENKIEFPPHMTPLLKDIVRDFTKTSQLARLGLRRPGTKAIREHSWFTGFDWASLEGLTMAPPIPTKVRSKTDISNFEEYTGSEQDEIEALPSDWRPAFPYEVINGKTQLFFRPN